jgi:hypothetical protein
MSQRVDQLRGIASVFDRRHIEELSTVGFTARMVLNRLCVDGDRSERLKASAACDHGIWQNEKGRNNEGRRSYVHASFFLILSDTLAVQHRV